MDEIWKIGSNTKQQVKLKPPRWGAVDDFIYDLCICLNGWQWMEISITDEMAEMIIEVLQEREKLYPDKNKKQFIEGYQPNYSGTKEPPKKP
jgi:hypothetical protein